METRKLGGSELELTTIGLGTWAIGGPWQFGWGAQDDADSIATILKALELGINWIDTAAIYGCGHSEFIVGMALRETSNKPLVATKCGLLWDEQKCKVNCLEAKSIIAECEDSLKRLGVEVIDLYQMHWPVPDERVEEAYDAMATLVQQGKVRHLGVSNFTVDQLKRIADIHPLTSLQPPYNMIQRDVEDELLGYCRDNNIGVVGYSPMYRGMFTENFSVEKVTAMAEDDHRKNMPDFNQPTLTANVEMVEKLKSLAHDKDCSVAQLAISWVLRRDEVTSAIVGARKPGQIEETVGASEVKLNDDEISHIEEILAERLNKI